MCGIAGLVWHAARDAAETEARLECMRDTLRHRGPDDSGIHVSADRRVGLLNTRLAIRDLTPAAHMPMRNGDGTLCLTYNGEIFNAAELREELERAGYAFRSTGDTEVVLAGYQFWQEDVVGKLRGMFAFAIADSTRQCIFMARDPLGIKPLYYAATDRAFVFGSELKALLASGLIARTIDRGAVAAFLQLGSVPAPLTMIAGVRALEPGHTATVEADQRIRMRRYYSLPSPCAATVSPQAVRNSLASAVESHLAADVAVGAFLSGGLDSSAVVALAAQFTPQLVTCSVRFDASTPDESRFARAVAERFGTRHHEVHVSARDMVDGIAQVVAALDQPSIDGFNTYFISKAAAGIGLKVVLSGLGGDEIFGGYPTFRGVPRVMRAVKSVRVAPRAAARAVTSLTRADRWRKVAAAVRRPAAPESAYLTFRGLFTEEETAALSGGDGFDAHDYVARRAAGEGDVADWVSRAELRSYTANQLLRDADVMSMAHSLELRVPLLDTDLVDAMLKVPAAQRLSGKGLKPLLRAAVQDLLPQEVLSRREKQGFTFPMAEWLNSRTAAPLWEWGGSILDTFDSSAMAEVAAGFRSGRTHWSRAWSLIVLNEWSRQLGHA